MGMVRCGASCERDGCIEDGLSPRSMRPGGSGAGGWGRYLPTACPKDAPAERSGRGLVRCTIKRHRLFSPNPENNFISCQTEVPFAGELAKSGNPRGTEMQKRRPWAPFLFRLTSALHQFCVEHLFGLPTGSLPKAATVQAMVLPTPTYLVTQLPLRPNATQPVPALTEQVPPRSAHLLKPVG